MRLIKLSPTIICSFDPSDLPGWGSDVLAIACTGGGLSKRQLYTDEEDVVLSVRGIGINAINLLISGPING